MILIRFCNTCEQWIAESLGLPYRNVLGIVFGNVGRGIAERNCLEIDLVIFSCIEVHQKTPFAPSPNCFG